MSSDSFNPTISVSSLSSPSSFSSAVDVVVVVTTLLLISLTAVFQRYFISPSSSVYRELSYRDRFDWDRRSFNIFFQVLQTIFNVYILATESDVLYGYSRVAHYGFLVIIAFYIYDTIGIIMHPLPSNPTTWIVHHFLAIGLLLYDVALMHSSAFPAAIFLLSAAGHIPNEVRWFLAVTAQSRVAIANAAHVLCILVVFVTCVLPPPYLLVQAARQLQVPIYDVFFKRMRVYCIGTFLLIYVPHILLIYIQVNRAVTEWNHVPGPFRHRKVE